MVTASGHTKKIKLRIALNKYEENCYIFLISDRTYMKISQNVNPFELANATEQCDIIAVIITERHDCLKDNVIDSCCACNILSKTSAWT